MKHLKLALILLFSLFATELFASERLVYAVTSGVNGGTDIFSIAPGDDQPARLFSDATSTVVLAFAPHQTAVVGDHLLAPGKERSSSSGPGPPAIGIYEFSLDGSGKYRKILDLPSGERVDLLVASSDGAKLAFLSLTGTSLTLFIHDVKTGGLLHKLDMLKIAQGGVVRNAGWFPNNKTIFFTVESGPGDLDDDCKCAGTWVVKEDGTELRHLPLSFGVLHESGYGPWSDDPPTMLGVVGGQYIFSVMMVDQVSRTPPPLRASSFLALCDPHTGKTAKIALQHHLVLSQFVLSHSGQYIAYVQQNPRKFVGNKYIDTPEHVWIQPVPGGDPKEVFFLETGQERRTYLTVAGWISE